MIKTEPEDVLVPVFGYDDVLLGYWNETQNVFEKLHNGGDIIINNEGDYHWRNYPVTPLQIQISKTQVHGIYHTYRALGAHEINERTLIYIA